MKNLFTLLFFISACTLYAQSLSISSSESESIYAGANVIFTASTSGITNPTYQWYENSVAISGAMNSTYSTDAQRNGDQFYVSVVANISRYTGSSNV